MISRLLYKHKKSEFPSHFVYQGTKITDHRTIADSFNKYFAGIGSVDSITSQGDVPCHKRYIQSRTDLFLTFKTITLQDTLDTISKLNYKDSTGFDGISTRLFKKNAVAPCYAL